MNVQYDSLGTTTLTELQIHFMAFLDEALNFFLFIFKESWLQGQK